MVATQAKEKVKVLATQAKEKVKVLATVVEAEWAAERVVATGVEATAAKGVATVVEAAADMKHITMMILKRK